MVGDLRRRLLVWPILAAFCTMFPSTAAVLEVAGVFPQFPSGSGFELEVMLLNRGGTPVSGEIRFYTSAGTPMPVAIGSVTAERHSFSLPSGGSRILSGGGGGVLQSGYAVIFAKAASSLRAGLIYTAEGNEVSVSSVLPATAFEAVVQDGPEHRSAIAVVNSSAQRAPVVITLTDANGTQKETLEFSLAAGEQRARFVDELFSLDSLPFAGKIRVESEFPFSAAALRLSRRGSLASLLGEPAQVDRPPSTEGPALFNGAFALQQVALQAELGSRPTGSPALREAGDRIVRRLEEIGWSVAEDRHALAFGNVPVWCAICPGTTGAARHRSF